MCASTDRASDEASALASKQNFAGPEVLSTRIVRCSVRGYDNRGGVQNLILARAQITAPVQGMD